MSKSVHNPNTDALDQIAAIAGPKGVVDETGQAAHLTEWRGRWRGDASIIVAPKTTKAVSEIVKVCAENNLAITPQGGNTGLVGGQIPFDGEVLLSLKRMRQIREIEPLNNSVTVDAGVTLQEAQEAAKSVDRLFPLSIGSEGSCQIGGVISTNAGGVNVLRYGNTRDLVLGLEAVLPNGEIWDGLKRLRKNNTGYDLKHLFIGGEGTLGIVTGAVLKLFPRPADRITVFAGCENMENVVRTLAHANEKTGGATTSFEFLSQLSLKLVLKNIQNTRAPLDNSYPAYILMEFSAGRKDILRPLVEGMLTDALDKDLISDVVIAENEQHANDFWRIRHAMSEAINHEGLGARHDVSVATSDIPAFLSAANAAIERISKGARAIAFGHVGDGNVHYDVVGPPGAPKDALDDQREDIENAVYEIIDRFDGSFSAEHGVGMHKRRALERYKSPVEQQMMRAVKDSLDPAGIMNPGKIL